MKNERNSEINRIIQIYNSCNSIMKTSRLTGVSTVKVRKILITEGLWESDTSRQIRLLLDQESTTEDIAKRLNMSVKNVQAYMPYERGVYGGESVSPDAKRSEKYRNRMRHAAAIQVIKANRKGDRGEMQVKDNRSKCKAQVLKLHLELDLKCISEEEVQILRKYGSMKKSISRDILVPADITLHALNYAILRMFGWQNGHLHNYSLPEKVFKKLTENSFQTWAGMAGVYFRFPTENYEDIYWDDDYREGQSIRSWMKKKYTGPYRYKGYGEHYLMNQMEVQDMFAGWQEITVREFAFGAKKQPEPYQVRLSDATIDQVTDAFADIFCEELIERLPLAEILLPKKKEVDYAQVRDNVSSQLSKTDIESAISEYMHTRFKSEKQKKEFLMKYDIPVSPITEQLIYSYDFGDGWKVFINCENVYTRNGDGDWEDSKGENVDVLEGDLEKVIAKYSPVCIEKDGIELVDDVGGIYGFCRMLQTIYETDTGIEEDREERESMLGWADMMGWTGRKIGLKQTL